MKTVLAEAKAKADESSLSVDTVLDEIICKTKSIKDCIIYDKDGTIEEEKIDFNRIIQFCGDRTGYEVSCNELRFHTYRKEERLWLDEDLNKYDIPILCYHKLELLFPAK